MKKLLIILLFIPILISCENCSECNTKAYLNNFNKDSINIEQLVVIGESQKYCGNEVNDFIKGENTKRRDTTTTSTGFTETVYSYDCAEK